MKKRFFAVLMVITMFLSVFMSGCAEETAFSLVNNAVQKTEALTAIDATMSMEMVLSGEGISMEIPMVMDIKGKDIKSDSPVFRMLVSTEMFGQSTEMDIYQEGDMSYVSANGIKYKMATSEMEDDLTVSDKQMNQMIKAFPENVMQDVQIISEEDGTKTVEVVFSDAEFQEIFADFIKGMQETAVGSLEGYVEITLSDMKVKVSVNKNGYISNYFIGFKMAINVEGETVETTISADIKYNNHGAEVEVTAPEGYKDFPLVSAE